MTDDRLILDASTAFWTGLAVPDTGAIGQIEAVRFPGEAYVVIPEALAEHAINGAPLVWQNPDRTRTFVNGDFFSDLAVVDATVLDGVAVIGTARPSLVACWPAERILRFLLTTGIVRTFAHVEAELVRCKCDVQPRRYCERFEGCHVYFTNEEVRAALAFTLTLDETGRLSVQP
jgi:hypothetical protein